jgi:predicted transcriptional regulator
MTQDSYTIKIPVSEKLFEAVVRRVLKRTYTRWVWETTDATEAVKQMTATVTPSLDSEAIEAMVERRRQLYAAAAAEVMRLLHDVYAAVAEAAEDAEEQ